MSLIIKNYLFFFGQETLSNLNFLYYVLNHKIVHLFPQLHAHFKIIGFSLDMVFTSNFLTLFTGNLNDREEIVLEVIDIFLVQSWVGLLKLFLLIIKVNILSSIYIYLFEVLNINNIDILSKTK